MEIPRVKVTNFRSILHLHQLFVLFLSSSVVKRHTTDHLFTYELMKISFMSIMISY